MLHQRSLWKHQSFKTKVKRKKTKTKLWFGGVVGDRMFAKVVKTEGCRIVTLGTTKVRYRGIQYITIEGSSRLEVLESLLLVENNRCRRQLRHILFRNDFLGLLRPWIRIGLCFLLDSIGSFLQLQKLGFVRLFEGRVPSSVSGSVDAGGVTVGGSIRDSTTSRSHSLACFLVIIPLARDKLDEDTVYLMWVQQTTTSFSLVIIYTRSWIEEEQQTHNSP